MVAATHELILDLKTEQKHFFIKWVPKLTLLRVLFILKTSMHGDWTVKLKLVKYDVTILHSHECMMNCVNSVNSMRSEDLSV